MQVFFAKKRVRGTLFVRKWANVIKLGMKKLFSLLLAVLAISTASACLKNKSQVTKESSATSNPIMVLVMDTTQALLPNAELKIGKNVYKTSFDGRIVLKPEMIADNKSFTVSCEGYNEKKVDIYDVRTLVVRLVPKAGKKPHGGDRVYLGSTRGMKGEVMYKMAAEAPAGAVMDYAVAEEAHVEVFETEKGYTSAAGSMANNVSAGKLTAGEVNDFTKWNLWPSILENSHKQYISDWRITARERYTVTVMDKHGYPVANYPVNLTDKNGNTVFQALTDNTGKAELWNGLVGPRADVQEPKKVIVIDEDCPSLDVDVLFVFDATGSMGDELRYLQAEMKDVIARAKEATGGLNIRTGAVVYRDHGDEYVTRISPLTEDIATTQAFIDKQHANGGGDYPEAVPEALMAACNSSGWNENARARIAFLVLDAPCHQDSTTIALLHEQVLNAAALGIRIVPVVCSGLGESGELLVRSIALATNGTSFFLTDDSGIGDKHLKPTTDSLKVEHLNDMLVRTIVEFSYMPDCTGHWHEDEIEAVEEQFIPNPFNEKELEADPTIPHGPTTLYLLDVSGKLIYIYQGVLEEAGDSQLSSLPVSLSTGIYFVKAYYDGEWHVKKILVH